jgi:L-lysine exporter family protein LysE/ArgO
LSIESAGFEGALISLSLIVAIGAQNAFVIRQGLSNRHVFLVCTICAFSDATLISLGVFGFGEIISNSENISELIRWFAISFLIIYSIMRFKAAYDGNALDINDEKDFVSAKKTAIITLGFTWLNPHVYLDTTVLIGTASLQFQGDEKIAFAIGAMMSSFLFFYSLGFGARRLAPLLKTEKVWKIIDVVIGIIMIWIAWSIYAN